MAEQDTKIDWIKEIGTVWDASRMELLEASQEAAEAEALGNRNAADRGRERLAMAQGMAYVAEYLLSKTPDVVVNKDRVERVQKVVDNAKMEYRRARAIIDDCAFLRE